MTTPLEDQISAALDHAAAAHDAPGDLCWDRLLAAREKPYWRRAPRRTALAGLAVAAGVALLVALVASRAGGGPDGRLHAAGPPPAAPAPAPDWKATPTADSVVFRTTLGPGAAQLGTDERPAPNPTTPGESIARFPGPIAVAPDERHVYIADAVNDRIVRVDAGAGSIDHAYPMPGGIRQMAVDPATGDVYTLSDAGVIHATSPAGATRRVAALPPDEAANYNLRAVDEPAAEAGVYGLSFDNKGAMRLSPGPAVTLPSPPLGGAYMGIALEGPTTAAAARDRQGDVIGEVALTSETAFPDWIGVVGGTFRVVETKNSDGRPPRTALFVTDGRPSVTAVYALPLFTDHLLAVTPHAVWALERSGRTVELHKVVLPGIT